MASSPKRKASYGMNKMSRKKKKKKKKNQSIMNIHILFDLIDQFFQTLHFGIGKPGQGFFSVSLDEISRNKAVYLE